LHECENSSPRESAGRSSLSAYGVGDRFIWRSVANVFGRAGNRAAARQLHRFMAGVYFGSGLIALWAALTIRQERTIVFLIALSVFLAGTGRLVSISQVGLPQPNAVWLGYLLPELFLPWIMAAAQIATNKRSVANRK
jgi:Domain of unknown function (DUF4345)